MDDRFNTAAGWVLGAAIVALGASIASGMFFHADSGELPEGVEPGYFIEGEAEEGGASADPTVLESAAPRQAARVQSTHPKPTL